MQAWKKTSSYLRYHSWYADTLGIDYQSVRVPRFIREVQQNIDAYEEWESDPLEFVPAPKSQRWQIANDEWVPCPNRHYQKRLRPLAHVSLRDQVVATAILLCLADRVETQMGDTRLSLDSDSNRKRTLAYGHRLHCDRHGDQLRHRWGSSKLYRQYFQDYQVFLDRPSRVAAVIADGSGDLDVAIVHSDLSKFYDRVSPDLLAEKLAGFRRPEDDPRFFKLSRRVLHWRWQDARRAERHASEQELPGFMQVALPQGLVSAGFLANVVMQDFENALRQAFGRVIDQDTGLQLVDAAYYVDDFRLVLLARHGQSEREIAEVTANWLQARLDDTASGLSVEPSKTRATVEGRDRRFLVPQSRAARRIQSEVSGTFDMLHGTELIGAIEGFFHTQKRYSSDAPPDESGRTGLLIGFSDMRDDTAARFAAGRFRRTFRSLRPLLAVEALGERAPVPEEGDADQSEGAAIPRHLVLSKQQLDERGKLFAALLIEEWIADPANVRLLRIALDLYPDVAFLEQILALLKPGWTPGASKGARREVRLYCLSELFRAGATETGIVADDECLPGNTSPTDYHSRLTREAQTIFSLFIEARTAGSRLPWYLMQQVFLYLSARNAYPDSVARLRRKGGAQLTVYRHFAKFLAGSRVTQLEERTCFLVMARTGFGLNAIVGRAADSGVSSAFLEELDSCSPTTAAELWQVRQHMASPRLRQTAEKLGLSPRAGAGPEPTSLPELATQARNPFLDELNLLQLADWLFSLPAEAFEGVVTPSQIQCTMLDNAREFGRVDSQSYRLSRSPQTAVRLFEPPDWSDSLEDRRRYQIGMVLRFAIRGTTGLYSAALAGREYAMPRYSKPVSHWQMQRYGGFQGRSAFGPPWLPLSSAIEDLLFELLRWPGAGVSTPMRPFNELARVVRARLDQLLSRSGSQMHTLLLEQRASLPHRPATTEWARALRVGIVQTVTPDLSDFAARLTDPELSGDSAFRTRHRAHLAAVMEAIAQMVWVRETHREQNRSDGQILDLLVFPELAIHRDDILPILVPFIRTHRCIMLFGKVYHREASLPGSPLVNTCQWMIPSWSESTGFGIRAVEQGKKHLAQQESAFTPRPTGFRPAQWLVEYEWHSDRSKHRPLVMSASVCYDATDLALAYHLRERSDLYIICALNQDVGTFDRMSEGLHYHMYQGLLLVNNGQFGGSSFYMPFERPFHRQVFHLHGQPQVSIAFAEISPDKLINRPVSVPGSGLLPKGEWKKAPAGWSGPSA